MARRRSRFFLPGFCAGLGVVIAIAFWIGGQRPSALWSLGLFLTVAAALLLGGRSETVRMVRGDQPDERWAQHDLRATAFAGITLIVLVLAAWIVSIARGHDGSPYQALGAVSGVAYLSSVVYLRLRG
jgi:drug/metabolite transporter (DMT)-like permease